MRGTTVFFALVVSARAAPNRLLEAQWTQELRENAQEREVLTPCTSQNLAPVSISGNSARLSQIYPFLNYVDVFYGTQAHGHMFPGTTVPFGMCKMGVDVIGPYFSDSFAGYQKDGDVCGVSMVHESGIDTTPSYGVVSQLPMMAKSLSAVDTTRQISFPRAKPDVGHIGYYKVCLDNHIDIEFSSSNRSGVYKYTFPVSSHLRNHKNPESPVIMVNVTQHLHSFKKPWWSQNFQSGFIKVSKDLKSYRGLAYFSSGPSKTMTWSVSFFGIFDKPAKRVRAFKGNRTHSRLRVNMAEELNLNMGILFEFEPNTRILHSHVGVSFNDIPTAMENINLNYSPDHMFDLNWSVQNAVETWNTEVFSKVLLDPFNENPVMVRNFYNSLYGSHLMPTDRSGLEAPWPTKEPYYDDWSSLWKTFRCLMPMFNILNRPRSSQMIRSLIEIWRHEGFMPDGRIGGLNTRAIGGSSADIVLADGFVKGINAGINWPDGFRAMQSNAEQHPSHELHVGERQGRVAISDWLKFGYVTRNFPRSMTRTMEYAYNDFALSVVAKGLGLISLSQKYLSRSSNWQNIWNFKAMIPEYAYGGFIQPKDSRKDFISKRYDPLSCFGCYWRDDAYMGLPIEYGWAVPRDVETLKSFIGSDETFKQRLDDMFGLYGDGYADSLNEPSLMTPFLYNFINQQFRTSETLDYLIDKKFSVGPKGLPRDSGAGSMQAWLWFAISGFYPIAGTDVYLMTSPKLSKVEIKLEGHAKAIVLARNLYPDGLNSKVRFQRRNNYIESVKLNGISLNRSWFTHDELFGLQGGTLEFKMTDNPVFWDKDGDLPPSPGHYRRNDISVPNHNNVQKATDRQGLIRGPKEHQRVAVKSKSISR
ncbi:LANO_0E14906g1_1 [Lachancea nothofagi CBS 11611]|uniref:LANO_0E14906g1_1 n=1 Tax=Lachancea nothofagi CBS 11611 TaxID=1266666 RepID=A0A1G4K0H3_9SACH|nr:LANO_0E14906g1_1 [Lachancea nothofagi CBS 11611]